MKSTLVIDGSTTIEVENKSSRTNVRVDCHVDSAAASLESDQLDDLIQTLILHRDARKRRSKG